MKILKYLSFLFIFISYSFPIFANHTFRAEVDLLNARTEWNEYSTVNQANYTDTSFRLMVEYLMEISKSMAVSIGSTYNSLTVDTPVPSQALSNSEFNYFEFHGNGIMLFNNDFFGELGFYLMRMPYFGNGIAQTVSEHISTPAIKAGIGVNAKVGFGLARLLYRLYYHLSGTFEDQSVSGITQEYKAEFYFGKQANYGMFFKFQTSNMEGDYDLINDQRSIGVILKLSMK